MPQLGGLPPGFSRPRRFARYRRHVVCDDSRSAVPVPHVCFPFGRDLEQSNPDAGDPNASDSNGMGAWAADGDKIKGRFVEIAADRTTRQFVSRGEISFLIQVNGNAFSGTASAIFYDAEGRPLRAPLAATLAGQRVVP